MNYRRVLLLTELGNDLADEAAAVRRVAPRCERLVVLARTSSVRFAWLSGPAPDELKNAASTSIDAMRAAVTDVAPVVEVTLATDFEIEQLSEIAAHASIDLVVAGALHFADSSIVAELRRRRSVAVLWPPAPDAPRDANPIDEIFCIAFGRRAAAAVAVFLRDHAEPAIRVTILAIERPHDDELSAVLDIAGVEASVEVVGATDISAVWEMLTDERKADLVVLARQPPRLLFGARSSAAVLVLPPAAAAPGALVRAIDVPDIVDEKGDLRFCIDYAVGAGRRSPIPDQDVAFVSRGGIVAVVRTVNGQGELPASISHAGSLGVFRTSEGDVSEPVAAIEMHVAVVRPGSRPLVLFDAEVDDEDLPHLARLAGTAAPEVLAVRMRPMKSCRALRARLEAAGLDVPVVDASVVLDEGDAFDVPEEVDPVRLARVGARMRAAGFPLVAIVYRGPHAPLTIGFMALAARQLDAASWRLPPPTQLPSSLDRRLDATTGAGLIDGNSIELELDNATARCWLLDSIAQSRARVHLQVYMATDDEVGRQVEQALTDAAARGITVRVLVDSLHALHGSLGATNPLLERLGSRRGIELRVWRPITGVPSVEELKQRDHRKLVVIDGSVALVGGRNISHEYYTGFDEVTLNEQSAWREVPWLDSGARVEGPAVSAIEASFREAWLDAGGASFDVVAPAPRGSTAIRVVVHRGLRDARTLEAYLALIDTAVSHVYAVNGFPLILEIQHALIRARARGVRVRTLFGHVTPTHGGEPFGGLGSSARMVATELVHSRMDALVAAGGEAYQLAMRAQPRWVPSLGTVSPHVHAKVMSVDGRVCAVGSANLDITAGYWESELLLVIEDESVTRKLEATLDQLIAGSDRVNRDDPKWQETARRRQWMRHWPGVLSV